ncbi:HAMP domain-containing sensor histidine kinase [Variovorax sp. J22R133]|uniref:surface-behavior sensor histidine kinase ShkS n=1 Tax=Variovorax brevis TaxID=3053503 RepID=UPI00257659AD|nr:HAMP domain-containing sensor histidine kinase [Variovorax sp. J22R133]MDM0112867.1 HAMP domain-containing sensor histidine kinase [Variovorax sp. J22R133]
MRGNSAFAGLGNSSFASLTPAPATADEAEPWVRGELIRSLMRAARGSYLLSAFMMPTMAALCWGHVPNWQLLAWLGFGVVVTACRVWGERVYATQYAARDSASQQRFMERFHHLWSASGLVWGLSILIFFERAPLVNQFMCWLIVAGVATFPLNSLSLHPPLLNRYINALFISMMCALFYRILQLDFAKANFNYGFLALPLLHWWMLLRAGRRIHETARNSFELLYHNHILINSLTQQRQAAVAAVAMKNRFLASAAHDMRQPVLALSLYADWLRNEPELVQEIAPKIVRATHAVNALFDSLFDLARIDSGQVRLHIARVDVKQLLHDLELQYRPVAEAKGLTFRVHATAGTVLTDPIRVRRMIGNLIANAIKYTAEGGVLIASRHTRDGLRVEVWDTGIGIAREHLRDVFLEFYKVADHAGTSDGFGLGLAIVARLSHALGHPVSVRSRLGRGSVFRVALHDADEAQAQSRISGAVG